MGYQEGRGGRGGRSQNLRPQLHGHLRGHERSPGVVRYGFVDATAALAFAVLATGSSLFAGV